MGTRTPKGMLFGGFLLHKTNQKAFLWVSWYLFLCFIASWSLADRLFMFLRNVLLGRSTGNNKANPHLVAF